ncbi:MAG: CoA transferase [Candidatus Eremiobacteraeota bacterium]|nr:CoA transferase [Candidatus Eremiobacteraeota bacterium]
MTDVSQRPPLDGVRVLDFTHVIAGPYCTMMLADMGADVVKVERPGLGDDLRHVGRYEGRAPHDEDYFYTVNRRKRSIALDLATLEGLETALRLVDSAEVAVFNFAPKTVEKLGFSAETLLARNPRLVYCSLSGFGKTGPLRDRLAMDPIIQAYSGIMSVTGEPSSGPMSVGAPIADVLSGMFGAYAIVCALMEARRTGKGTAIDVSMLEAMIAVLGPRMGETLMAGKLPSRVGNENPMRVPAGMFAASDGKFVSIMSHDQSQWPRFCSAIGHTEWIEDPRFVTLRDRVANREELHALAARTLATAGTAAQWVERFTAERVPCAPVYNYKEALEQEQIADRGLILELDHPKSGPIKVVGPPWKTTLPDPPLVPPPLLGNDGDEVLAAWLQPVLR